MIVCKKIRPFFFDYGLVLRPQPDPDVPQARCSIGDCPATPVLTIKVSIPNFYRKLGPAGLIVKNKGEHLQETLKVSGINNHVNLGIPSFNIKMSW